MLLALAALLAAGALSPSPASAQFGFPGGGFRIPIPIGPGMFAPPGSYRGYSHSTTRRRSHEEDNSNNAANGSGATKDDLSKTDLRNKSNADAIGDGPSKADLKNKTADKPAGDSAATAAVNVDNAAVKPDVMPKAGPAVSDASHTVEANAAVEEHGPDFTPER